MRESLVDYAREYGARGAETAVAYWRGYRMEKWSYARIADEAKRFARELEALGVTKGDAVALWAEASAEWVAAFWGCVLRGAVIVPLDPGSRLEFVSRVIDEVQAKLILCSHKICESSFSIPTLFLEDFSERIARHSAGAYASPALSRQDPLEIIFTSGTTAEPRGVVISHGNVLANIEPLEAEIRKYLRYEKFVHPLRFLLTLPLSHIFGQIMGLFVPPLLGGTVIFPDSLKPSELMETIRRKRVSVVVAVPRALESLQREVQRKVAEKGATGKFQRDFAAAEKEHFLWRWWRFRRIHRALGWKFWAFISGGAALREEVETFWTRLGYAVIQGYGMTETTSLISLNHPFRPGKGSIGEAFPGMEIRVGQGGQILVRGKNIAASYQKGQVLKPVADKEGWFATGDLAEVDKDGRLYFKGREKNVIVTPAGMKVFPEDLEAALRKQKGVRDCVVVGLDRNGNAEACAALLLEQDAANAAAAIVESANRDLAEYQRIRYWFAWPDPDFPRTATQKPQLARIREAAEREFGGQAEKRNAPAEDSITSLVARIAGHHGKLVGGDVSANSNMEMELNLSSLDRLELLSALEDRYQVDLSNVKFSETKTAGDLEKLIREPRRAMVKHIYARWPQQWLITRIRLGIYYLLVWPATCLLAAPRIIGRENLKGVQGPVLVISNHVTYVDIGWILAALPVRFRHRLATAMGGERLSGMRTPDASLSWLRRTAERLKYVLVSALFNVFPLPKDSGFAGSFSFAGGLVDHGWNILIFPEGATTQDGCMMPFRPGIGLLAVKLHLPVVPMRLEGLWELQKANRHVARPGQVLVKIGKPLRFSPEQDANEITKELEKAVAEL